MNRSTEIVAELASKEAYEVLFKTHYAPLCAYACGFVKEVSAAEEAVQEIFVKLWHKREDITITQSVKAYLYTAVRNACLNQIKHIAIREEYKIYNQETIERSHVSIEDTLDANTLQEKIRHAIDTMPPVRKKVFTLSRYEGLKYHEIAAQLNISVKTVEHHMGKAIQYMRIALQEYLVWGVIFGLYWLINQMK